MNTDYVCGTTFYPAPPRLEVNIQPDLRGLRQFEVFFSRVTFSTVAHGRVTTQGNLVYGPNRAVASATPSLILSEEEATALLGQLNKRFNGKSMEELKLTLDASEAENKMMRERKKRVEGELAAVKAELKVVQEFMALGKKWTA